MWTEYEVRWDFLDKLCGSVPGTPELIKGWLEARQPKVKPPGGKSIDEINEEVLDSLAQPEDEEEIKFLTFQGNGKSLVLRAGTIKAHIKDCARRISALYVGKVEGEKAFSTKVINGVYPDEQQYWIPISRPDGGLVSESDGQTEKPIHFPTPRGPRSALKLYHWIDPATIKFKLKVLGKSVSEKDLNTLFTYGGVHGYGGERGDGEGKYTYKLTKVKEA